MPAPTAAPTSATHPAPAQGGQTTTPADEPFPVEPIWDALIAERGGRGPAEFEGHECWEDSEEAVAAVARGEKEAAETAAEWLGWDPERPREWPPRQFPEP